MSSIGVSSFRPKESSCPLAYASKISSWITADALGTIHQMLPSGDGKMSELISIVEEEIKNVATNPAGDLCVVVHSNEADVHSLPDGEGKAPMFARKDQPITHAAFDNAGNHMYVQIVSLLNSYVPK
jgi:hypothetical protein